MNLFVENIPEGLDRQKLEEMFSKFGFVEFVHISEINEDNKDIIVGIVEMPIKSQAHKALKKLNGKKLIDRKLKISIYD